MAISKTQTEPNAVSTPTETPTMSAKEALRQARLEMVGRLTQARIAMLEILEEMASEEVKDDYETSLFDVVSHYGEKGISSILLNAVFGDGAELTKARKALEAADPPRIKVTKEKQSFKLSLVL
jgi:hypothetical protein